MKWLRDYIAKKNAKDRCGLWPFQFPKGFSFTECCAKHDEEYISLRVQAINSLEEQDPIAIEDYLHVHFSHKVKRADESFFKHMRRVVKEKPWWNRWVYFGIKKTFIAVVEIVGLKIWIKNTLKVYDKYRDV